MFGMFGKGCETLSMPKAMQELAKDQSIFLLDVRETDEYKQGHIQGSVNIPLGIIPAVLPQKMPDKKRRVFVYCLSGARSAQACRWLAQNGYEAVVNIGGISAWNGPIVRN
jgi:phage shock protein E